MTSSCDGVRAVRRHAGHAEDIGQRVVELAEEAASGGTFGVGGVILTKTGAVFGEAVNAVIRDGRINDPTAHVERQLIDWLFGEGARFRPHRLDDVVIVSSLDPCAMCAGAILRAGVNVVSLAADEQSGVHGAADKGFSLPDSLHRRAERHMALFGVDSYRRPAGADFGPVFREMLPAALYRRAELAFATSVERVRGIIGGDAAPPTIGDAAHSYRQVVERCLGSDPGLFRFPPQTARLGDHWPDGLSCVLEDHNGYVILGMRHEPATAPTASGVVRLVRAYSRLRNLASPEELAFLPHPRWCTIVVEEFPASDDLALFELGAIGSFMEEQRPPQARPALLYLKGDDDRPRQILESLPPLYGRVIGLRVARRTAGTRGFPKTTLV